MNKPPDAIEELLSAFDALYKYANDDGRYSRPNRARLVLETWLRDVLAAAPVPCAASPADELEKRIGALATFPQHVYAHMGDSIGRYIVTVEVGKVFALIDELLRATGEGARDAQEAETADGRGSDARPTPRVGEIDGSMAPEVRGSEASDSRIGEHHSEGSGDHRAVAVSLDPHRLLTVEEIDFLLAHTRQLLENQHWHGERVETCDAPGCAKFRGIRARLRGEATVRPEKSHD